MINDTFFLGCYVTKTRRGGILMDLGNRYLTCWVAMSLSVASRFLAHTLCLLAAHEVRHLPTCDPNLMSEIPQNL